MFSPVRGRPPRIVIVGGGPGGLMTAYEIERLVDRPVEITILEASDRVGGKILTPSFDAAGVRYEAGAAEFYDYEHHGYDPLKDLVRELGLPIATMSGASMVFRDRVVSNLEDVRESFGDRTVESLIAWDRTTRNRMTPAEFYGSDDPRSGAAAEFARGGFGDLLGTIEDPAARGMIECFLHSDLATEPDRTSVDYGLQNHLMNDAAYMRLYGIVGGNQRLPEALAARLRAAIRLGARVTAISADADRGFELAIRSDDRSEIDVADVVILALPHDAVPAVTLSPETLAEPMRDHWSHHDHPAHYLRITMLFDRPFWRSMMQDSYCMLDAFGGCCLYDESSRVVDLDHGVLGWLVAGEDAVALSELADDRLADEVLAALPPRFGRGDRGPIETRVHRWRSAVNALPGGTRPWPIDRRHQPAAPDHPDLHVVGDYLYDSTLNGVHDSATHVASCIAADLVAGRWSQPS